MRRAGRRAVMTEEDCQELEDFERFLELVGQGVSEKDAYAQVYGQILVDRTPAPVEPELVFEISDRDIHEALTSQDLFAPARLRTKPN